MSDHTSHHHPLFRRRDGHHAKVSYAELFFDLVYVFAVTDAGGVGSHVARAPRAVRIRK